MVSKKIVIASDHNGNAARAYIVKVCARLGYACIDVGPTESEGKVDYPDMVERLVNFMRSNKDFIGVLVCGTGTGMVVAANKYYGIRAGLATDRATAELMREHNDCNVIVFGQWRNSLSEMDQMIQAFVETPFGNGRHISRVNKLDELDKCVAN